MKMQKLSDRMFELSEKQKCSMLHFLFGGLKFLVEDDVPVSKERIKKHIESSIKFAEK